MDDDLGKKLYALEREEEAREMTAARAEVEPLIERLRSGEADAMELYQLLRDEGRNAFTPYRLMGIAVALCEALQHPPER